MTVDQEERMVVAQFQDHEGKLVGPPLNLPAGTTPEQLDQLINQILENVYNMHPEDILPVG